MQSYWFGTNYGRIKAKPIWALGFISPRLKPLTLITGNSEKKTTPSFIHFNSKLEKDQGEVYYISFLFFFWFRILDFVSQLNLFLDHGICQGKGKKKLGTSRSKLRPNAPLFIFSFSLIRPPPSSTSVLHSCRKTHGQKTRVSSYLLWSWWLEGWRVFRPKKEGWRVSWLRIFLFTRYSPQNLMVCIVAVGN